MEDHFEPGHNALAFDTFSRSSHIAAFLRPPAAVGVAVVGGVAYLMVLAKVSRLRDTVPSAVSAVSAPATRLPPARRPCAHHTPSCAPPVPLLCLPQGVYHSPSATVFDVAATEFPLEVVKSLVVQAVFQMLYSDLRASHGQLPVAKVAKELYTQLKSLVR